MKKIILLMLFTIGFSSCDQWIGDAKINKKIEDVTVYELDGCEWPECVGWS